MICDRKFFRNVLFLSIFLLNIFSLLIPTQGGSFFDSEEVGAQILRNLGFRVQNKENYSTIPRLTNDSMTNLQDFNPFKTHLKQSEYYIQGWADTRWNYRKNITIESTKIISDLTNFPVLIDLYDPDLQTDARANGEDIMFTDESGNILDFELEHYNRVHNSTHAHLVSWVKSNLSSTQDTIISMYFGNPTASNQENVSEVWGDNYIGVWHLTESGSGVVDEFKDSSQYNNHGQGGEGNSSFIPTRVGGKIGYGQDFNNLDGYYDLIDCGNDSSFNITGYSITLEAWIQHNITPDWGDFYGILNHKGWYDGYSLWIDENSLKLAFNLPGETHKLQSATDITTNTWHHIVATYDGALMRIYVDGVQDSNTLAKSDSIEPSSAEQDFWIGHGDQPKDKGWSAEWDGQIDEVRISNLTHSSAWIKTEYDNQNDPQTFLSIGSKQSYENDDWAFPQFNYRKTITINSSQVSTDLTNFPVLLNLSDSDLHYNNKVQDDGDDIMFTDKLGTKLDHEIEFFDQTGNGTHAHLVAWVKVPDLLSTIDTNITMYYGNEDVGSQSNPEGVWDSNYVGVWHMNQDPPLIEDSTFPNSDGTAYGSMTSANQITGKIGGSLDFDATDDYVDCGNPTELQITSAMTVSTWLYADFVGNDYLIGRNGPSNQRGWDLSFDDDPGIEPDGWIMFRLATGANSHRSVGYERINVSQWYHVVGVYNPSTYLRFYLNGQLVAEDTTSIPSTQYVGSNPFRFGTRADNPSYYNGTLDEVRISNVSRSLAWIETEYKNQFVPDSFYSVGLEEIHESDHWAFPMFKYRKTITIDASKVNGVYSLSNFPILLNLSDSDLHNSEKVQADGDDILFSDCFGTRLDHEIELFDQVGNGTHAHLVAWVRVPILSAITNTNITMYYGNNAINSQENSAEVWDINFELVHHFDETTGTTSYDSTDNNRDGTIQGATTLEVSGMIGNCFQYDDTPENQRVRLSSVGALNAFTMEIWVRPNTGEKEAVWGRNFVIDTNTEGTGITYATYGSKVFGAIIPDGPEGVGSTRVTLNAESETTENTWNHLVVTYDGSTLRMYVNGNEVADSPKTGLSSPNYLFSSNTYFAFTGYNWETEEMWFDGKLDEARLSNIVRSVDWIATEYNNHYNPDSFYSVNSEEVYQNWWADTSFNKRKDIIINKDKVAAELSNFPVLIDITDNSLKNGNIQPDAADLIFISESGTKLNHEIEFFDQNSSHGHLIAWVNVPTIFNDADSLISMYYGNIELLTQQNPEGVWKESYKAVHHLDDNPTSIVNDSTSNNIDVTNQGGMTSDDLVSGWIGNGIDFDGINDGLQSSKTLTINQFTMSVWFYQGTNTTYWRTFACVSTSRQLALLDQVVDFWTDTDHQFGTSIAIGEWHYLVLTFNGSDYICYLDGTQYGNSISDSLTEVTADLEIGFWKLSDPQTFDGILDEVRISDFPSSPGWILTEYNNQHDPSNFYSVGTEIIFDETPPELLDFGVDDPGTGNGKFWAEVNDETGTASVEVTINNTKYSMSWNGTYWIYDFSVESFQGYYEFLITNASDTLGNYRTTNSSLKNHSFNKDTVAPNILQWTYITENNTFQANVTDSWGKIDTVTVNVTTYNFNAIMVYYTIFGSNTLAYMNDTISMPNGPIDFQIIVNDTGGNEFISTTHSGTVYDNHPPVASDLTLSRHPSSVLLPVFSNCTLYLDYSYYDQDGHGEDGTEIRWYKNSGTGFELQLARNDTTSIPTAELLKGDQWYATVRPKDGEVFGEINQTATITIQNTPPQVSSVVVSPSSPVTTQVLSVSNTTTDADGDSITTYQIRWYNPSYNASYDNQATIPSAETKKGETWWCELRAFDGTNYSIWITSNSVIIGNSAPSATNLAILPSSPGTLNTLIADYDFTDADNDAESGSIVRWYKNGVLQSTLNDSWTIGSGNTTKGDTWYFKITPSDGSDLGVEKTSDPVTILNTAPTTSNLYISPSSPVTTTILTANYTWTDSDLGDTESGSEIIWYRNSILLGVLNDSVVVTSSYTTKGDEWHFKVRASDGADYGTWTSCPTNITIGNTAPEATNLAISPGDAKTANDLIATYTWSDNDTIDSETDTIIYWYLDRTGSFVLQPAYTNLSILSSTATQKGDMWKFGVRPGDGDGHGILTNSSVITIGNTAPVVLNITINGFNETTMLQLDDNLTVGYIYYDADNADNNSVDTEAAVEIRWYNQSQLVTGLNDELIVLTGNTSSGEIWYCIIRVSDGTVYSNPTWSPSVSIAVPPNTPPNALNVQITPGNPKTGNWLNVSYVYYDAEGDPESFTTFRWYCNGIHQGQFDGIQNLSSAVLIKGNTWYAEVRPRDDNDYGDWNASATVVIGNTAPEATNLMILPISALTGSDLSVDYDWTDADGADSDTDSIIYWYLNRTGSYVLQSIYTNLSTLPSMATLKGDWWLYELTPNDGTDVGVAINSTPILIGNTAPTASNLEITPLNPITGDDLTADYDWLDQDTLDSESGSQIHWYKNGVLQPAYNDSLTVNAGDTAKGENWYFKVIPNDGTDFGSIKTSPLLTIGNTAPAVNNVEFTPGVPMANIDLSVTYDWSDVDLGDSESGTLIRWYRNDLLQTTYNDTLSIDGILIVKGDNWTVAIKASDGTSLNSTWVNTSVIVGNTAPTVTTVTISPSSPQTMDGLEVSYGATDIDSMDTIIAYSIEWYLGGAYQPQFNNYSIIPAANTSKGENWQARVKATDGEDWSDYGNSLGLTIGNTKPSVANVTITGGLTTADNITLTYDFVDVDNDPSSGTTITWRYVGYGSGTYNALLEIPASYTKAGQQWWVEITPRDTDGAIGETFNSWDYGMIIIIGNSPPTLNVSDIAISGLLNGTEYGGENFDTTYSLVLHYNATDIDGEQGATAYGLNLVEGYALGSEYRWYRNRSGVVTLISALNDQVTVSAQYTQKGDTWWVQIRVRDFFGDFSLAKNASKMIIDNAAPYIQSVYWSRAIFYTANSLSFSYTFGDYDTGDEEQGLLTRWYRNGTYLPEYNNNVSILAVNTTKGDHWYVNISVWDGVSYSVWVSLSEIIIMNSAPVATDILILPSVTPNTTQALNASWVFTDADGDAEELFAAQITWYRNGLLVPSLTNNHTVPASLTNREEVWYFTVRVTDGANYSVLYQSNTIRVINSAPSPSTIQINLGSSSIYTSDDLTVTWGFTDPDPLDIEDVSSTFILWYLNGQLQASFTNQSILPATNTLKGQQWAVSIAVRDNGGLWSSFLNSSTIIINNTSPQVIAFDWTYSEYYTTTNLSFSYLFADADNDIEAGILIHWYRDGVFLSEYTNNVTIFAQNITKGERWYVNISVYDGEVYSSWYSLVNITVLNSAPTALNVYILPMAPNTTQSLVATWMFQDLDADTENQSAALIQWYQNGILVPDLANQHNVSNDHTQGGDSWYFIVSVFDGSDYSTSYQSNTILILNSAPIALNIQLNAGEPIHTMDSLTVTWLFDDPDPQDIENISGAMILWFLNDTFQPQFTNESSIASQYLLKGQVWIVTIAVRDSGGLWSIPLNSSSVAIANSAPELTLHITAHPTIIVEETTLYIQSTYYTYFDADGDANDPQIWWYRNNIYLPAYDNSMEISAAHITAGDTWYYTFCPFDGTDLGNNHTSPIIYIESRPKIDDHDVEAQETMDGLYHFWVTASDTRNNITEVRYEISLNGSTSPLTYTLNSANTTGHWVLPFQLEDFAHLGTTASVTVIVTTSTGGRYSQEYTISNTTTFSTLLVDAAPPRIVDVYFVPNEDPNPSALTFFCELEEYGSGVDQVILYYSFEPYTEPPSDNAGSGASVEQTYTQILMKKHNETDKSIYYGILVPFSANGTNWKVIYQIHASDNAGNAYAFDILLADPESVERDYIPFTPPGVDPTMVLMIVGGTLLLAFFGSIVYVKFIRKPELVGLDKDLVLEKISEISDAEIMTSLDAHTIGIVVSFFDQRHGPIPIIVIPEMLKDNFTKLVELSDRSFSGTGFSDDFNAEIPSSYDFVVAHGLRTSIMSFGYALERPQARGGQENLTLNIIIHQDLFPLVQSFQKAIQRQVHKLHVQMDKKPDEKEAIRSQVLILRKYVTSIVLSYERLYGTTELIEEEY